VNGTTPGPALEVTEGDWVVVDVTNELGSPSTIHWHGQMQVSTRVAAGVCGGECGEAARCVASADRG
jgi:FtsP/CotA-like multicopper oxidase with cupredoxin domain